MLWIATKLEESVYCTGFGHGRADAQSGGSGGARWSCMAIGRVHEKGGSSGTDGDLPAYDSIPAGDWGQ